MDDLLRDEDHFSEDDDDPVDGGTVVDVGMDAA